MLSACAAQDEVTSDSVDRPKEKSFLSRKDFPLYDPDGSIIGLIVTGVVPNGTKFVKAAAGSEISLHSLIVMPSFPHKNGMLTFEFKRSDLREAFIQDFFFRKDPNVNIGHPFAYVGVESNLTDNRLILKLHPGVLLHLRNGMESSPDYKTFKNANVTGKITKVSGDVFYSSDPTIKSRLSAFYAADRVTMSVDAPGTKTTRRPDGSYEMIVPVDRITSPRWYPPRVIEGP